jgi:hypothetical protein
MGVDSNGDHFGTDLVENCTATHAHKSFQGVVDDVT